MEYNTKEMHVAVHSNGILELRPAPGYNGTLTMEEVDNNIAALKKALNNQPGATLIYSSGMYVKKDVLKRYTDTGLPIVATALIADSFASRLVGNLFLTLRKRMDASQRPTKIFAERSEAIKWLEKQLSLAKK